MTSPQDPMQPWLPDPNQAAPTYSDPAGYQPQPGIGQPAAYTPPAPGYAPAPGYPQQPGYPQPGYGYPAYAPAPPTNTLAIVALILAFFFAPAAIVCGHIARKQIRTSGESGDGLAMAGLICGYIFTALYLVFCGVYAIFFVAIFHAASTVPTDFLH